MANAIQCIDSISTSVNFNGNIPAIGEIWSFWTNVDPNKARRVCVEITDLTDDPLSSNRLQTQYTDCYDCVSQNYYVYTFQDCISNQIYTVPAYEFGSLPNLLEVYYMTLSFQGSLITSCFTFKEYKPILLDEFNTFLNGNKFALVTDTPQLNTDCKICLTSNSLSYAVSRCTDGATDYVLLINDSYIDNLISYSDGINQYCGTVVGLGSGTPPLTFINDYGFKTECDVCLATENQKILIQSCTDSEYTEVVWASTLYGGGEVSNLSTEAGCFEVIGLTEDPVTIDSFLNFDPQPGCDPCIECNGIVYTYESCYETSGFTEQGFIRFSGISENPLALGYNPDTQHMYVTTQSTRMIVIDPSTSSEYTRYTIPIINAQDILYYNTDLMYLTNSIGTGGIIELDTSGSISGTTTAYSLSGTYSYQVDGDLPNNRLFVTCSDYSVKIFDTNTNTVTSSIPTTVSGYLERYLAYHPINNTVYTTASGYYSVEVYDVATLTHIQSIGSIDGAYDIAYAPNSGNMYVTCSGYNNVKVIDTNTNTVIKTINTIEQPGRIKYNSTDGYMYVTTDSGLLTINPLTDEIVVQTTGLGGSMGKFGFDFYDVNNRTYINTNDYTGDDGVRYFELQNTGLVTGFTKSHQSLLGTTFYNPAIDLCCNITGTASGYVGDDILYSVVTFTGNDDDCAECLINGQPNIQIWNASACTASNTYSSFYVTTDSTAVQGDVVKLMWGSNEWICAQLLNTTSSYSGYYTYYNTQNNGSGTTLIYDSCENCNSQGLIGVTLVSCEAPYTEQFVSISLENYLQIYNFGSLTNYSVSDQQGNCFTITNLCPIPLTEEGFTPVAFYLNCFICLVANDDTPIPRSANTENFVCVTCCPCDGSSGSTFSVTPPHPVWTDGYGTSVTQLNMIVIGGINGLNG